ncbi:F-box domain-containing protein [Colletotrichum navitas]|uniref:F-box domain-containing protein n=1 Tax=Colletotrichum navitas TaxID=681940 RepID=A0AAD8PY93_9PEZI|nr:F-box domain-containing protein [Colletotrichum navitas]KAK1589718.1 F-box domain-containing protein [Colletotrichum navitas]
MAPPGQLPRVRSSEASIEKGRMAYADQRFRVALEHFTLVAGNCPCSNPRGSGPGTSQGSGSGADHQQRRRRERCTCRDFGQAAARHSRERGSVYAEATKECKCGAEKTWGRCHRESHVQALDYRAACFEKMGNLDKARRDAEWLLEIAPRRLEVGYQCPAVVPLPGTRCSSDLQGYMRLGKIYRLEKKPEMAWAAWCAGLEVGQKEGLIGTPKYEQLGKIREPLHKHFCRRDPLELPTELIEKIFSYFEFQELCRVSGVCKRWDHFLDTHPYIWREVHFPTLNPQKPPKVSFLKTLRKRTGGGARSLVIPNAHSFQLNESKWLSLIQTTNPQMTTRLEIGYIKRNLEGDWGYKLPPKPVFFQGVKELRLSFHEITRPAPHGRGGPQPFVRQFVERARENLEEILLFGMYLQDLGWPELPRLKVLQLTGPLNSLMNQLTPERRIDPFVLARATPNLEQLYMDNFGVFTGVDSLSPPDDCWSLWRRLQVIKLGRACGALSMGDKRHFPPLHPSSFRILDARAVHQGNHGDWLPQQLPLDYSGYPAAGGPPRRRPCVDLATVLLEPAIRSGRLRELGLCWRQDPGQFFPGALGWLRGAPSVRTFGFFNFDFESHAALTRDPAHRAVDPTDLLFDFLEAFPNLDVLELHSELCEPRRIAAVIERVARLGRLRRVYQSALTGAPMDQLRASCEAHGVELVYGGWDPLFPVPLEPLGPVEPVEAMMSDMLALKDD